RRTVGPGTARYSGFVAYRALVDAGRVPVSSSEPDVVIWIGPGQHAVRYPVSPERVNIVAIVAAPDGSTRPGSGSASTDEVLRAYRHWHPHLRSILAAADRV